MVMNEFRGACVILQSISIKNCGFELQFFIVVTTVYNIIIIPNFSQNPGHFPADADPELAIDILNLKSDPDLIEDIVRTPGVLPAYHMNKRHWLTVLLDGSCPDEQVRNLIVLSYQLTTKSTNLWYN